MPGENQDFTDAELEALKTAISLPRFGNYLVAAGFDEQRALRLYMWNSQIGEAFYLPLQAIEVGLRNRISGALTNRFNSDWWQEPTFLAILDQERQTDLDLVIRRIRNRNLALCTDQVVAGLSFGFWVGLLDGRYNPPVWSKELRTAFPHLPTGRARKSLAKAAQETAYLRNRISHHEPIHARDLSADYASMMKFLAWICPTKARWVKQHSRVPELLRQKP